MQSAGGRRISTPRTREKLSFYAANKRGDSSHVTVDVDVDGLEETVSTMSVVLQIDGRSRTSHAHAHVHVQANADNYCFGADVNYAYVTEIDCNQRSEGSSEPAHRFQKVWEHIFN